MSDSLHQQYIKKVKREKSMVNLTQWLLLFFMLGTWELAANLQWIDEFLFSKPSKIALLFWDMIMHGDLFYHTYVTTLETIVGFIAGTIIGIIIATIIWISPFLAKVLDPYFVVLNGMPKVALGPIFIVAFGAGYSSVIAMAIAISMIITTIVIYSSFRNVDPNFLKLAYVFGANKKQLFLKIILPQAFPTIISALKVNVGLSWVGVIVGEFLVSKAGLGYLIVYGFQVFNLTLVMLSLTIISILATLMYQTVAILERKFIAIHE